MLPEPFTRRSHAAPLSARVSRRRPRHSGTRSLLTPLLLLLLACLIVATSCTDTPTAGPGLQGTRAAIDLDLADWALPPPCPALDDSVFPPDLQAPSTVEVGTIEGSFSAMNEHSTILFSVDGPSGADIESVWARTVDDGYAIDNIPFYARGIALGDVINTKYDETGALWFDGLVRASGHSTVRLWFARSEDVDGVRAQLRAMRCPSELSELPRLVAVDIPGDVSYEQIKLFLDQGEADGIFEYEEACLGFLE